MDVTVNIIDGTYGHAAEGIKVDVTCEPREEPRWHTHGLTDCCGNFTFSAGHTGQGSAQTFMVRFELDAYFTSLGIEASYKEVDLLVRVSGIERKHLIRSVIAPSTHMTYHLRSQDDPRPVT